MSLTFLRQGISSWALALVGTSQPCPINGDREQGLIRGRQGGRGGGDDRMWMSDLYLPSMKGLRMREVSVLTVYPKPVLSSQAIHLVTLEIWHFPLKSGTPETFP